MILDQSDLTCCMKIYLSAFQNKVLLNSRAMNLIARESSSS